MIVDNDKALKKKKKKNYVHGLLFYIPVKRLFFLKFTINIAACQQNTHTHTKNLFG